MNEELIKGVADWLSVPAVLVVLAAAASGAVWLCWRTRSPSLLLERAWRILVGPSSSPDREAGKLLQEHQELLEIRFRHVPGLRTHRELLRLKDWLATNDEDIGDIGRCGDFFDAAQLRLLEERIPGPWKQLAAGALVACTLWIAVAMAALTTSSMPILQLNATGTHLFFGKDTARPLFGKGTLRKTQCGTPTDAADVGFTTTEAKSLCDLFNDSEAIQRFESEVPLQRFLAACLTAIFGLVCFTMYQGLRRARAARELIRRLAQRASAASSLSDCVY